jgi:hypothetical protein
MMGLASPPLARRGRRRVPAGAPVRLSQTHAALSTLKEQIGALQSQSQTHSQAQSPKQKPTQR